MSYTKEEIAGFEAKDLRISKLAITKSLIDKLPLEDVYDETKVTELADKYVDYIYGVKPAVCSSKVEAEVSWVVVAKAINIAIPNEVNVKILDVLMSKYKNKFKANIAKSTILCHIIKAHGKYPTNTKSVELILKQIKTELGEQK